jgi:wyosine [tRNA(Phe)-imidazoG37] synthetase (radical SAM superfamily)
LHRKKTAIMPTNYVFGPVMSRRLGISLGIDLVPHKTCNLNCVYCEVGRTSQPAEHRSELIPLDEIIAELDVVLAGLPPFDYITFSGAGEPTLHKGLGVLIKYIRQNYPGYKMALITNSILLADASVRAEMEEVDLIMPSLDAISEQVFIQINRPVAPMDYPAVLKGLELLRQEFSGQIWLEIFIIPGINDTASEASLFREALMRIKPDRIQINTLDRPGTEGWVMPADRHELELFRQRLLPLQSEIIARMDPEKHSRLKMEGKINRIVSTIHRRPCTLKDLSAMLALPSDEVRQLLDMLVKDGRIVSMEQHGLLFYKTPG